VKKILILTANPKNTDKLRLDEEVREIQAGLERAKKEIGLKLLLDGHYVLMTCVALY
jgi:hypothetical protein